MRYLGQGYEIAVDLEDAISEISASSLRARFESNYEALYGRLIPGLEVEILSWTLNLSETRTGPGLAADRVEPERCVDAPVFRESFDVVSATTVQAACHHRSRLRPGDYLHGPALISEPQTTVVVASGYRACVARQGALVIEAIGDESDG